MIALTLTTLFVVVAFATALSLADSWMRGQMVFGQLSRERSLAKAGFVPMIEAEEVRLRDVRRFAPAATRPFARRLPHRLPVLALDAA